MRGVLLQSGPRPVLSEVDGWSRRRRSLFLTTGGQFGAVHGRTSLTVPPDAKAIELLGEVGCYTGPYPTERIWRDVKLCEIDEGTSEIQRLVISRDLLKSVKGA